MRVATVIVNYRTPELVLQSLEALAKERVTLPDLKAVVVDNASGDGSSERLTLALNHPRFADWVEFLPLTVNGGFGWGNNQAISRLLRGDLPPETIYLMNPDVIISPGSLAALIWEMERRPDAGAIGSQLLDVNGSLTGSAFRFPSIPRELSRGLGIGALERLLGISPVLVPYGVRGPVDWVTGASVLLRSSAIRDAGMFDTGFFLYFEEVELMHRLKMRGWQTYHCPESTVTHVAGASTGLIDGRLSENRVAPDYLFHSRRRYFCLTGGRWRALSANLAWLAGSTIALALRPVTGKRNTDYLRLERKTLLRIGLFARDGDTVPAFTLPEDDTGGRPAWMSA